MELYGIDLEATQEQFREDCAHTDCETCHFNDQFEIPCMIVYMYQCGLDDAMTILRTYYNEETYEVAMMIRDFIKKRFDIQLITLKNARNDKLITDNKSAYELAITEITQHIVPLSGWTYRYKEDLIDLIR